MKKFLKKVFYTGVGFASLTAERIKNTVEGLVSDGKISEEEGKRIIEDLNKNTESKKDELESNFNQLAEKMLKSFKLGTAKDLENLEDRISVLESLLAKKDEEKSEKDPKKKPTQKKSEEKSDSHEEKE
jgi:polyhydroxyalkanoate synthesis regulator phasin